MRHGRIFFLLSVFQFLTIGVFCQTWHTPPDKWKEPRIFHTPFEENYARSITILRFQPPAKKRIDLEKEMVLSPNNAYWYSMVRPDTSKDGPWATSIFIFTEKDYLINIRLEQHCPNFASAQWINEKLIYVQFWLGRVLGVCFIFDVEAEKILYKEMVNDGWIPFGQWREYKEKISK